MIKISDLRVTFPNGYEALKGISFSVDAGQFVCVVGRSGAGKSTLMKCLNGSLRFTSGEVVCCDAEVKGLNPRRLRRYQRKVGFIYQEFQLVNRLSAMQNVLAGRLGYASYWRGAALFFSSCDRAIALDALEKVRMLHKAKQRTDSLSGGERQRVAIARALAQEPNVILADEPVANLDPELAEGVLSDIWSLTKAMGVTTLVNIHNVGQALRYADRIIGIAKGEVVFDGGPQDFDQRAINRVYRYDRGRDDEVLVGAAASAPTSSSGSIQPGLSQVSVAR